MKVVFRGDDLHNARENKTGVVLDPTDDKQIKVQTVSGLEYWDLIDCETLDNDN